VTLNDAVIRRTPLGGSDIRRGGRDRAAQYCGGELGWSAEQNARNLVGCARSTGRRGRRNPPRPEASSQERSTP